MKTRILLVLISLGITGTVGAVKPMRFHAQLVGFNAGGIPVATNATGHAVVDVIDDGSALNFKITVAGISNLFMAHIHVASSPVQVTDPAGPIAFWFTGGPPPSGTVAARVNGELAVGYVITDGQVQDWDGAGVDTGVGSGTVAGLIAAIQQGRASVVVHTRDLSGQLPAGGAGNSPAGELRGTLE